MLTLLASGKPTLEVPLSSISNAIILPSKTDVALEIDTELDTSNDIMIVRFLFFRHVFANFACFFN